MTGSVQSYLGAILNAHYERLRNDVLDDLGYDVPATGAKTPIKCSARASMLAEFYRF